MIYKSLQHNAPIRQGDIFVGIPRIDFSLQRIIQIMDDEERLTKWVDLKENKEPPNILVSANSVPAIVITQDCDASRSRDITLCEIRSFRSIEGKAKETSSPKSWKNIITQQARINQKWFYLPPSKELGFCDKMAVDFLVTIRVPRKDLESMIELRAGRLNDTASEHFRERLGQFFRRYPYDEWYALNSDELKSYKKNHPDVKPFPWQASSGE